MSGVVNVFVSSADTYSERRIDPHITVAQLKVVSSSDFGTMTVDLPTLMQGKLESITGIPASSQSISVLASQNDARVVAELTDNSKMLGYYDLTDWQVIKVRRTSMVNIHSQS
jgi:tubulin-folding cofactor B